MFSTFVFSGYPYLFRHIEFWQEKGASGTCVKWNSFSTRWTFLPTFVEFFGQIKKKTPGSFNYGKKGTKQRVLTG